MSGFTYIVQKAKITLLHIKVSYSIDKYFQFITNCSVKPGSPTKWALCKQTILPLTLANGNVAVRNIDIFDHSAEGLFCNIMTPKKTNLNLIDVGRTRVRNG